jgi:hypothetical protein
MKKLGSSGLFLIPALFLAGCWGGPVVRADAEPTETPQYSANKGIWLPEATRQSLGLERVDVVDRKLEATFVLPVRVFQSDDAGARAGGMATPAQAGRCHPGQAVQVRAADGRSFGGRVAAVNEDLQQVAGLVEVVVDIAVNPEDLPADAFLEADIAFDSGGNVAAIPTQALLTCSEGDFVYAASGDHFVRTAVKVGMRNGDFVEIADGLYAGDQVVLKPVLSLWLVELAAVKGGQACCIEPPQRK